MPALTNGFGGFWACPDRERPTGEKHATMDRLLAPHPLRLPNSAPAEGEKVSLLLQLALERLDLLGERGVGVDQILDLAHGMQHGGVVTAAKSPSDLGERA